MAIVYLALGSNVGDSSQHLKQAVGLLGGVLKRTKQAPVYRSKAVGYTDQPDFLNTALSGQTDLAPEELLSQLKDIEGQIGRTAGFHWGPREIDIDIILYDDLVKETAKLILPHPSFRERDFVLQPLNDLSPSIIDPVSKQTVKSLLAKLSPAQKSLISKVD